MKGLANLRTTLAERLAHYRELRDWDQHDLAAAVRVSVSCIRGYEQKKRWPKPEELERLADALGVTAIQLLSDRSPGSARDAIDMLAKALQNEAFRITISDAIETILKTQK